VPALLKTARLFVMNSLNEGLCSAILEARRCGLAVVATRTGGIPESVVEGVDADLVAVGDAPALAGRLIDLLADEGRRLRYGTAARTASEATTAAAMAQAHRACYRDLLGESAWAQLIRA
jgi:glycosyltransferase involved in cell wall biosynthesis